MPEATRRERLAVVGAGVSGLVAAYLLQQRYEVEVFEAADYAGGHTNTVDVATEDGVIPIDTGFIVYNETNYPAFTRLLAQLSVATQPTTMSFGFTCERTGLEYNGSSINQLLARRRNMASPQFLSMVRDILRFHSLAGDDAAVVGEQQCVTDYVREHNLSRAFYDMYLLPIGASIWSAPPRDFGQYPVRFVLDFLRNHGMLRVKGRPQWRVIGGGSRTYVRRMLEAFDGRLHLGTPVRSVHRDEAGVRLSTDAGSSGFDRVVFACHSDQAMSLLDAPTALESEVLGALRYQPNLALLHTDSSLLPRRHRAWGAWNYRRRREEQAISVTYNMNILQGLDRPEQYCVTLNDDRVESSKVIRSFEYHHPVYSIASHAARQRQAELIGPTRSAFCGAYWGNGFHEDGVQSALAVASYFGCEL